MCKLQWALRNSRRSFLFGDDSVKSLGVIDIKMVVPGGLISFSADVVPSNVPLLIGLDILDQFRLQFLSVTNQLEHVDENGVTLWRAPVIRKHGHGYYCWDQPSEIMYTKEQLIRLHRHLHHPATNVLLSLLKRASPDEVDHHTKGLLEDISKACIACQTYSTKPVLSDPYSRRCHLQPVASSRSYVP
jgi:hypothetical protein